MQQGLYLSFDFGTKRIGVATGQTITGTASPLCTLSNKDFNKPNWDEIQSLIEQWKPQGLVVGLPLNMDDTDNHITKMARKFATKLSNKFQIEVIEVDERLSSREVHYELERLGKKFKGKDDALAACLILERFLIPRCC